MSRDIEKYLSFFLVLDPEENVQTKGVFEPTGENEEENGPEVIFNSNCTPLFPMTLLQENVQSIQTKKRDGNIYEPTGENEGQPEEERRLKRKRRVRIDYTQKSSGGLPPGTVETVSAGGGRAPGHHEGGGITVKVNIYCFVFHLCCQGKISSVVLPERIYVSRFILV